MENLCISLLERLQNHQFTLIKQSDYDLLAHELWINHFLEKEISSKYFELRNWIYKRVAKDIVYQKEGYLNDHFCIGAIYGICKMYDELENAAIDSLNWFNVKEWIE